MHTEISGVELIEPKVFSDERGFFFESFHAERYIDILGRQQNFLQDNVSFSKQGVLRGLHAQKHHPQAKLVQVLIGKIFDVAVDIRSESATFGQWVARELSDANHHQLYIPPGFAHGFCVLSEEALVHYKCSDFYDPNDELTLAWDDPALAIKWPVNQPKISDKDAKGLSFNVYQEQYL